MLLHSWSDAVKTNSDQSRSPFLEKSSKHGRAESSSCLLNLKIQILKTVCLFSLWMLAYFKDLVTNCQHKNPILPVLGKF